MSKLNFQALEELNQENVIQKAPQDLIPFLKQDLQEFFTLVSNKKWKMIDNKMNIIFFSVVYLMIALFVIVSFAGVFSLLGRENKELLVWPAIIFLILVFVFYKELKFRPSVENLLRSLHIKPAIYVEKTKKDSQVYINMKYRNEILRQSVLNENNEKTVEETINIWEEEIKNYNQIFDYLKNKQFGRMGTTPHFIKMEKKHTDYWERTCNKYLNVISSSYIIFVWCLLTFCIQLFIF